MKRLNHTILLTTAAILLAAAVAGNAFQAATPPPAGPGRGPGGRGGLAGMSGVLGPDLKPPAVPPDFDGEGIPIYDTRPPSLPPLGDEAVLVFSKTTWFRDDKSIQSAVEALKRIANNNGWSVFATENGAVFNADILKKFKAVVWNNVSGDVLTPDQREAFKSYIENGGGFVGVHGSEGDPKYAWKWYVETLIGAQFRVHSSIQPGTIHVEDLNDPATHGLPQKWTRTDEWYVFTENPRPKGVHVLVTVDEKTYNTMGGRGENASMGVDHPVVWKRCVGKGRSFVNAMGHSASVYNEPLYLQMLQGSISWAMGLEGEGCPATVAR
jgi:uncharacterized protein